MGRDRVLPQLRLRDLRAEVAGDRAHVAVQQLVPGLGEGEAERVEVLVEAARDLLVLGIHAKCEVGGEHRGLALVGRAVRVGDGRLGVLRHPLVGAGRALLELPLVAEEVVVEAVAPLGRGAGPGDLEAGRDRVGTLARAVGALPAQPLPDDRAALRLQSDVVAGRGAVGLAERVAAGDQGDGLLVVHRHPLERLADVVGSLERVGLAVGALGVDVDEPHLDRTQRVGELAFTAVALVAEPGVLRSPEDLLGLPDVLSTEAEAEGLEAHVLERHVAGEDQEVGPRDLLAVLLLDRPEQPAGLVEVRVVRPAVERREPLAAVTGAATAVLDPVGAGGVPAQPDHQAAVVTEVGRPPVLRGVQHLLDVLGELLDVQLGELLGVAEALAQGVAAGGVLVQRAEVELVGPPVLVGVRPATLGGGGVDCRVLALGHGGSFSCRRLLDVRLLVLRNTRGRCPSR